MKALKKPPALRRGDMVGVIAPASPVKSQVLAMGIEELRSIGYNVVVAEGVLAKERFYAGEHAARASAFLQFLENSEIRAIFCTRGGYGSNYVVENLSSPAVFARLKRVPPRIVMGLSDVTTLLLFLRQKLGWVTFQGPMISGFADGQSRYNRAVMERVLSNSASGTTIDSDATVIRAGRAQGRLTGGCLSLVVTTLGTPDEIDTRGAILLLEDIDEKPYRVDRMLFHLKRAGKFRGVKAVAFGEMVGCAKASPAEELRGVIEDSLAGLDVPLIFGLRFGHTTGGCLTLPLGVEARLDARETVRLKLLEPAVNTAPKGQKSAPQTRRRFKP
jgi:muramoyltetrapeptide carboxypeptidase